MACGAIVRTIVAEVPFVNVPKLPMNGLLFVFNVPRVVVADLRTALAGSVLVSMTMGAS